MSPLQSARCKFAGYIGGQLNPFHKPPPFDTSESLELMRRPIEYRLFYTSRKSNMQTRSKNMVMKGNQLQTSWDVRPRAAGNMT